MFIDLGFRKTIASLIRGLMPITLPIDKEQIPAAASLRRINIRSASEDSSRQFGIALAKRPASRIMGGTYVGRSRFIAVPKEQPPRKLSGKRTSARPSRTLERGAADKTVHAEGITISGARTEGAHESGATAPSNELTRP